MRDVVKHVAESQSIVWRVFKWCLAMLLLMSPFFVACLCSVSRVVKFLPVSPI